MELLNIVLERPLSKSNPTCPFCYSDNIFVGNTTGTLLGYSNDPDPNHYWTFCSCNQCHQTFIREIKANNMWYTQNSRVLAGIPNCFEDYTYTCAKCSGPVNRHYTKLNGEKTDTLCEEIVNGKTIKKYKTFYYCQSCGYGGETEKDYYDSVR